MNTRCSILLLLLALLQPSASFLLNGSSKKKGLAVSWKNYRCGDFDVLKGAHWWYDWRSSTQSYTDHCNTHLPAGYVPMVWGWHRNGRSNHHDFGHHNTVLGFNEPNHRKQSNLTYTEAAHFWPEVEKQAGSRTLVSPAAAPCGRECHGNVLPWFTGFFHECKGCRFDYLATHFYGCNAGHTMAYLEDLWNRFHLKIWLTEFSCAQAAPSHHLNYMKQVLPRLEAAPFVYRYSWFSTRSKSTYQNGSLLKANSSELTELGRFYMQF